MLPTEAFAEVVGFLPLFDLSALAVTNALCSSVAIKTSKRLRCEAFPGLRFCIGSRWINVTRNRIDRDPFKPHQFVTLMMFPSEDDMADFVAAAFPNCVFEDVVISRSIGKRLLDAIGRVAGSVIVSGSLHPRFGVSRDDVLNLARKFRKVKALHLIGKSSIDEVKEIRRISGIQELWSYNNDGSGKKLTLLS